VRRRWLLTFLLATLGLDHAVRAQDVQKQVLVLYSTGREAQLALTGERELPRLLDRGLARRLDYYSEYIDAGRFQEPGYLPAFSEFLRLKYAGHRFDLVIAMLDVAIDFVAMDRQQLFPDTPVVFFALDPVRQQIADAAGVIAQPDFTRTLTLATDLQPEIRQVFVVSGASNRDREYASRARAQFTPLEAKLSFTYLAGLPTAQLEERLRTLPSASIVYYLLVNRDGDGENYQPLEYLDRVTAVANRPVYSWTDSTIGHGVVGGSMQPLEAQVDAVADLALRVLRGERAGKIGTLTYDLGVDQVDWRQLARWGISDGRIPSGATVLFQEPSAWARYRIYLLGAAAVVLLETGLIAGLLVQRARRRRAEAQARRSESDLRTSHDRIRDLGRRLLTAQEAERSRIARELHDDVSQQLATLTMDLDVLGRSSSPEDHATLIHGALDRARQVASTLHSLSHRLHPAKLRLMGLIPALTSLQSELSHADFTIDFVHEDVPDWLPQDRSLCLFRVAQEAVHNAIKHSGARKVTLRLRGVPAGLSLTVADDGVGFDASGDWGKGLGLISIVERLELVGGTLTIHSQPGAGTRLEIVVPLEAQHSAQATA